VISETDPVPVDRKIKDDPKIPRTEIEVFYLRLQYDRNEESWS
jgi:hypothetical protein